MAATLCGSPMYMVSRAQLSMLGNLACILSSADFFHVFFFKKNLSGILSEGPNSLDPDHYRHFVRPDLGPNYFLKFEVDGTNRQKVKRTECCVWINFYCL